MKKAVAAMLTAVLCISVLAGCGSKAEEAAPTEEAVAESTGTEESGEAEETGAEETPAETEAPAAAAEGAETAAVSEALADGVLNVGTNAEFPPFEYVNDDGEPDGFDIALIKAIGEKLGVEVQVDNMEFASLVSSIGTKIDVSIAGMTVTEERLNTVDFSRSYL